MRARTPNATAYGWGARLGRKGQVLLDELRRVPGIGSVQQRLCRGGPTEYVSHARLGGLYAFQKLSGLFGSLNDITPAGRNNNGRMACDQTQGQLIQGIGARQRVHHAVLRFIVTTLLCQ